MDMVSNELGLLQDLTSGDHALQKPPPRWSRTLKELGGPGQEGSLGTSPLVRGAQLGGLLTNSRALWPPGKTLVGNSFNVPAGKFRTTRWS